MTPLGQAGMYQGDVVAVVHSIHQAHAGQQAGAYKLMGQTALCGTAGSY